MPTILVEDGYRFFLWSNEGTERAHVHVEKAEAAGKWWLDDLSMEYQDGYNRAQLRRIRELLKDHQQELQDAWDEHFA